MYAEPTVIYRDGEIGCFRVEDLVVYRDVGVTAPTDTSWKQYLGEVKRVIPRITRCLVLPRAAGLTARQREEIRGLIGSRPTAVLTASVVNRCVITSLSWFKLPIRAFRPGAYADALRWLDCEALLPRVLRGLELYPPSWSRHSVIGGSDSDAPPT